MTPVELGMPAPPTLPALRRRVSRQVMVGGVPVGGDAPVSVQSMTTTRTCDIDATLQQIAELTATGCHIVRVAVPSQDDADALAAIAAKSQIPVIADIHFQPRYVFAAIDAGCAAVRVNPGNIKKFDDKIKQIAAAAAADVPIRIGVNAGSLDPRLLVKHGHATPEALVESALWECSLFEEHGFRDIKISVKHHDPLVMIAAYRQLAARCDYPLHLGVTEAGPRFQGTIKSAVAFGVLLDEGIGDTIRVSLSAPPVEEVKVGHQILESLGLRPRRLEIVSCPSCGRAQVDVYTLAEQVTAAFDGFPVPLRIAVMGCVVNGPGEAREADLGVSAGNGKGQIFVRGKVIKTVPEHQIVQTLIDEALARYGRLRPARPQCNSAVHENTPLPRKDRRRTATDAIHLKLKQLFNAMDTNNDGYVEWADYQRLVDRYLAEFKIDKNQRKGQTLRVTYQMYWLELLRHANRSELLSRDEYIAANRAASVDTSRFNMVEGIPHAIVDIMDIDDDNEISKEDFAQFMKASEITAPTRWIRSPRWTRTGTGVFPACVVPQGSRSCDLLQSNTQHNPSSAP